MDASEQFRKFAGECRAMAKLARSPDSKATWDRLATRWVRCLNLMTMRRRQRVRGWQSVVEGPSIAGGTRLPEPAELLGGLPGQGPFQESVNPCSRARCSKSSKTGARKPRTADLSSKDAPPRPSGEAQDSFFVFA